MAGRLRAMWAELWRVPEPEPNATCPECGRPIVAAREWSGLFPIGAKRTRAELLASCPVHGRRPHDDASQRPDEPDT